MNIEIWNRTEGMIMAWDYVGPSTLTDQANHKGNGVALDLSVPAPFAGIIRSYQFRWSTADGSVQMVTVMDDGTNIICVGADTGFNPANGLNTRNCWVPIVKGGLIGLLITNSPSAGFDYGTGGTNSSYTSTVGFSGPTVGSTIAKTDFTTADRTYRIQGTVYTRVQPFITGGGIITAP